jgi:TRAP-type mannitol/chloroaromatic compound transport system permease small subunit
VKIFPRLASLIDRMNRVAFQISAVLAILIVLLTTQQVVARYFFAASSIALQELEWHLFGAMFLLAGAHTYELGGHVKVDVVLRLLPGRYQTWIERFGIIFFLLPTCFVIGYYGVDFAIQARDFGSNAEVASISSWFLKGEASPDPGGLKARWFIRSFIPLSALLLGLQGISQFIKTFGNHQPLSGEGGV